MLTKYIRDKYQRQRKKSNFQAKICTAIGVSNVGFGLKKNSLSLHMSSLYCKAIKVNLLNLLSSNILLPMATTIIAMGQGKDFNFAMIIQSCGWNFDQNPTQKLYNYAQRVQP